MNLHQKLIEIRKVVPYLQKTSNNTAQGFRYTSSSQVLGAIRKEMDERGVLLVPEIVDGKLHEKSASGGKMHVTELKMKMTWVDAEKPEVGIPCEWYAQGTDQHEKGVGKALTYAEKFFILKFFNIATDKDDPDAFEAKSTGKKEAPKKAPEKGGEMSAAQRKFIKSLGKAEGLSAGDIAELVKWVAKGLNVDVNHYSVAKALLPEENFRDQIEAYTLSRTLLNPPPITGDEKDPFENML